MHSHSRQVIVAISGGIGSGKSVVSRMLATMGYSVYDCDSRAKRLMDSSDAIKAELVNKISPEVVVNGVIDRQRLASIVFADKGKLAQLNAIVHSHVKTDIEQWAARHSRERVLFVETAILYKSGLYQIVDYDMRVSAPKTVRIHRVIRRNATTAEEVERRIGSQREESDYCHPQTINIVNDDSQPILPQLLAALKSI